MLARKLDLARLAASAACPVPPQVGRHGGQVLAEPLKALLRRLKVAEFSRQRHFRRLDLW